MTPSEVSPENREFYELFDRCNQTELYQIAKRNGHAVQPDFSREALIKTIIGEGQPLALAEHAIDEWRRAIMRFLIDHKKTLETQITCPAKSFEPDACFGCVDAQVLHCVNNNGPNYRNLIALKKSK